MHGSLFNFALQVPLYSISEVPKKRREFQESSHTDI